MEAVQVALATYTLFADAITTVSIRSPIQSLLSTAKTVPDFFLSALEDW